MADTFQPPPGLEENADEAMIDLEALFGGAPNQPVVDVRTEPRSLYEPEALALLALGLATEDSKCSLRRLASARLWDRHLAGLVADFLSVRVVRRTKSPVERLVHHLDRETKQETLVVITTDSYRVLSLPTLTPVTEEMPLPASHLHKLQPCHYFDVQNDYVAYADAFKHYCESHARGYHCTHLCGGWCGTGDFTDHMRAELKKRNSEDSALFRGERGRTCGGQGWLVMAKGTQEIWTRGRIPRIVKAKQPRKHGHDDDFWELDLEEHVGADQPDNWESGGGADGAEFVGWFSDDYSAVVIHPVLLHAPDAYRAAEQMLGRLARSSSVSSRAAAIDYHAAEPNALREYLFANTAAQVARDLLLPNAVVARAIEAKATETKRERLGMIAFCAPVDAVFVDKETLFVYANIMGTNIQGGVLMRMRAVDGLVLWFIPVPPHRTRATHGRFLSICDTPGFETAAVRVPGGDESALYLVGLRLSKYRNDKGQLQDFEPVWLLHGNAQYVSLAGFCFLPESEFLLAQYDTQTNTPGRPVSVFRLYRLCEYQPVYNKLTDPPPPTMVDEVKAEELPFIGRIWALAVHFCLDSHGTLYANDADDNGILVVPNFVRDGRLRRV